MLSIPVETKDRWENNFWAKVNKNGSIPEYAPHLGKCWIWTGAQDKGYGIVRIHPQNYKAHRISYTLLIGTIPEGLMLDHLCRNPSCVNPEHLEPVTNSINVMRGVRKTNVTHCPYRHEYSIDNTYLYPCSKRYPNGRRECKTCSKAYKHRWYLKNSYKLAQV